MSMAPQPIGPARVPDPVALVRGHRWWRAAGALELSVWVFGAVTLLLLAGVAVLNQVSWVQHMSKHEASRIGDVVLVGIAALLLAAWLGRVRGRPEAGAVARTSPRRPAEIEALLAELEGLVELLERGDDRAFDVGVAELELAIERLEPAARTYLDDRGVDLDALRRLRAHELDYFRQLSDDRRRAAHHELVRFIATVRSRSCGDPYRSRFGGPSLRGENRDPALGRTRRLFTAVVGVIVVVWLGAWLSIMDLRGDITYCNVFDPKIRCALLFDGDALRVGFVLALMTAPAFLVLVARAARGAAWRAWAAALPDAGAPSRRSSPRRAALLLAFAPIGLGPALAYAALAFDWVEAGFVDILILAGLIPFGLLLTRALADALLGRGELRRHRRRVARAGSRGPLLEDLCALRLELAEATPPRREHVEQLATVLAGADELGCLDTGARDRVVARLEAAAERGPALTREHRAWLLAEVRACEAQISGGRRG